MEEQAYKVKGNTGYQSKDNGVVLSSIDRWRTYDFSSDIDNHDYNQGIAQDIYMEAV